MMSNPQHLVDNLGKTLSEWAVFGRRSQLEAVMPQLDTLAKRKVGYEKITELLERHELVIKPDALRQALHRWRKKQESLPSAAAPVSPVPSRPSRTMELAARAKETKSDLVVDSPVASMVSKDGHKTNGGQPNTPVTRARLQEIRKQHVDLDALVREGRKLNSKKNN